MNVYVVFHVNVKWCPSCVTFGKLKSRHKLVGCKDNVLKNVPTDACCM